MRKRGSLRLGFPLFFMIMVWTLFAVLALASSSDAVWPETGDTSESSGKLDLDYSHSDQGYVMARVSAPGKNKFKLRITSASGQLTYDLNSEGEYEVFPLQLGEGKYDIALFENVSGNKYSSEGKVTINVALSDPNAPYLVTNQYVDYDQLTEAVKKSDELTAGMSKEQAFQAICQFMADEFQYDFIRAATITSGTLPEIDGCFENRAGICQDLSAVTACMLRVQGIPCRLVIGYADQYYHAWTVAVVNGEEIFFDPTEAVGAIWAKKHSVERMY